MSWTFRRFHLHDFLLKPLLQATRFPEAKQTKFHLQTNPLDYWSGPTLWELTDREEGTPHRHLIPSFRWRSTSHLTRNLQDKILKCVMCAMHTMTQMELNILGGGKAKCLQTFTRATN